LAQIEEAVGWWAINRPAAPDAVTAALERVFTLIAMQPRIGAIAQSARLSGVRRIHLARVHYDLYYQVGHRGVVVLALWHTGRGKRAPV
jgi:plasmid stabilization system protein ParE